MSKESSITAKTATEVSFKTQLSDFESLMNEVAEAESCLPSLHREIKKILDKYWVNNTEGVDIKYISLDDLVAYKKIKDTSETIINQLAKKNGYHFQNIAQSVFSMDELVKRFGEDIRQLFNAVADAYRNSAEPRREVDDVKTAEIRKDYEEKITKLIELESTISANNKKIANIEKYVGVVEKISNIASHQKAEMS